MGCFFLEKDKSITFNLHKVHGPHVEVGDELYGVSPSRIRFIRFPLSWPSVFQQIVPVSMYQREDYQPLDINSPTDWVKLLPSKDSAIEVSAVLEPRWLAAIVRGTKENAGEESKLHRMAPILAVGVSAVCLIMIFVVFTKISGLSSELSNLEDLVKLMK